MTPIHGNAELFDKIMKNTVVKNGCWEWTMSRFFKGYGSIGIDKKSKKAHRIIWEILHGPTKLYICHHCDNPPCCNPAHLFAGTHLENMQDMARKKKVRRVLFRQTRIPVICALPKPGHPVGQAHHRSKLRDDEVMEIRRLKLIGVKQRAIALKFKVSPQSISAIIKKKRWIHLE